MAHLRKEIEVREQPPESVEPDVVERRIYIEERRRPRFLLGLITGALLVASGIALFAGAEGSYRSAGAKMDQNISVAADTAGEAVQ
jgi:hypothetical protein